MLRHVILCFCFLFRKISSSGDSVNTFANSFDVKNGLNLGYAVSCIAAMQIFPEGMKNYYDSANS